MITLVPKTTFPKDDEWLNESVSSHARVGDLVYMPALKEKAKGKTFFVVTQILHEHPQLSGRRYWLKPKW